MLQRIRILITCTQVDEIKKRCIDNESYKYLRGHHVDTNTRVRAACLQKVSEMIRVSIIVENYFDSPVMLALLLYSCAVSIHTLNFTSRSLSNVFFFCYSSEIHDFERFLKKLP
jgi:hypothetical protein